MVNVCAHCGTELPEGAKFCPACGREVAPAGLNTVQDVFDIAVRLMDAQNESTGSTNTSDTKEYMLRTPSLLNSILDRAYPASDTYPKEMTAGVRPVCPKIAEMTDEIALDQRLCTGVLPYGLAGLLLSEENPTLANFFWQTFLEQLEAAMDGVPSGIEDVENVYGGCWGYGSGGIEYGQFSRWG